MAEIWDPLRRKNVALTPEEGVRQWFIRILNEELHVPLHKMMSEVAMQFGEDVGGLAGEHRKTYRADIVAYGRRGEPLLIVECKRPETELTQEVLSQALRYNAVLDVRYIAVTNGRKTYFFRRDDDVFTSLGNAPMWEEMSPVPDIR